MKGFNFCTWLVFDLQIGWKNASWSLTHFLPSLLWGQRTPTSSRLKCKFFVPRIPPPCGHFSDPRVGSPTSRPENSYATLVRIRMETRGYIRIDIQQKAWTGIPQAPVTKKTRGLQGDVVYLCWPIASSYIESKCGEMGGLPGLSQWVRMCTSRDMVPK
jgi:hypothetical protein